MTAERERESSQARAAGRASDASHSLAWADSLPLPVWVVGEDGRLTHLNPAARKFLGRGEQDPIGHPCHQIVAGACPGGAPFCCSHCDVVKQAAKKGRVDLFDLQIDTPEGMRWLEVAVGVLPARGGRGFRLVHIAKDVRRERHAERFVDRLALRSAGGTLAGSPEQLLSPRELEVLRLMSEDATLESIATRLGVSYATVRNHVQHILAKLDAHSMLEAIARFVLEDGDS